MRLGFVLTALAASLCPAFPAAAQYDRVERSAAEIALEQAKTAQDAARALRTESIRACGAADPVACFTLGDLYRKGEGGMQDYAAARKAYAKGCRGKHAESCATLAYMNVKGSGEAINLVEARRLYKLSCDLGEVSGCAGYGNLVYTGKGGAKNTAEGGRYLREACDDGYAWACDRVMGLGAYNPEDDTFERLKDAKSRW